MSITPFLIPTGWSWQWYCFLPCWTLIIWYVLPSVLISRYTMLRTLSITSVMISVLILVTIPTSVLTPIIILNYIDITPITSLNKIFSITRSTSKRLSVPSSSISTAGPFSIPIVISLASTRIILYKYIVYVAKKNLMIYYHVWLPIWKSILWACLFYNKGGNTYLLLPFFHWVVDCLLKT